MYLKRTFQFHDLSNLPFSYILTLFPTWNFENSNEKELKKRNIIYSILIYSFIIFRCTSATYGALTSTSVTVNNTEYDPQGGSYHRQSAIGKAIQVNVTINEKTISKPHF